MLLAPPRKNVLVAAPQMVLPWAIIGAMRHALWVESVPIAEKLMKPHWVTNGIMQLVRNRPRANDAALRVEAPLVMTGLVLLVQNPENAHVAKQRTARPKDIPINLSSRLRPALRRGIRPIPAPVVISIPQIRSRQKGTPIPQE